MYSATPEVKADWNTLLTWVLERAALPWNVMDYDAPAPLSALWSRDDLGLTMMCGLPFAQRAQRPIVVAAPVPSPARYGGRPVYFTDIVVRADSPLQSLEDTFGGVVGYTLADSMSGGVALRLHLDSYRKARQASVSTPSTASHRLYRSAVGGLINARGVINALAEGRIDAGPLDSYYHDLLSLHDPAFTGQVRIVASTPAAPIPPLVATAELNRDELSRLRAALLAAAISPDLAPLMQRLLLTGFAFPPADDYLPLAAMASANTLSLDEL